MRRRRKLAAFVLISAGFLLVATSALGVDQGQVTAGSFCANEGDTGHTSTGKPMQCTDHNAQGTPYPNGRLRWRSPDPATTTTTTTTTTTVAPTPSTNVQLGPVGNGVAPPPAASSGTHDSQLAFTGTSLAPWLALLGIGLIGGGGVLAMRKPLRDARTPGW